MCCGNLGNTIDDLAVLFGSFREQPLMSVVGLGVSLPQESMSAVTAGSPRNSIARGRSSICHDRATRRSVLNFPFPS
jgi:hypothetical protein